MIWKPAVLGVCVLIAGCGGGGGSSDASFSETTSETDAEPIAATGTFAVRQGYRNFAATGGQLPLTGSDNSYVPMETIPAQTVTWEAGGIEYSRTIPEQKRPIDGYTATWSGTVQTRLTKPSAELSADPHCALATQVVDITVALVRARDGYRTQDGIRIAYTSDFKPVCAFRTDGTHWNWRMSSPLPLSARIGALSPVEFTSGPAICDGQQQDDLESRLTGIVSLEPDTIDTAFLSFTYKTMPDATCSESTPVDLIGQSTEYRIRISPGGSFLGLEYIRTGPVAGGDATTVITLRS